MNETVGPIAASIYSRDFEELRENLTGWDHEYTLAKPGGFTGRMMVSQPAASQISNVYWGNQINYRGTSPPGTVGMGITLSQSNPGTWLGRQTAADDVVIQQPRREARFLAPDEWDALVLSIPVTSFMQTFRTFAGDSRHEISAPHGAIRLLPGDAANLRAEALQYFRLTAEFGSPGADDPVLVQRLRAMAEQLERGVVAALARGHGAGFRAPHDRRPDRVVSKAVDLVRDRAFQPVGIMELCAELNMGERALHGAFQAAIGVSPVAWLRRVRLNQVYRILRHAEPERGRIKRVALEHGFTHFGRFTQQYAALFDELPSQTLSRA